MKKILSLFLAIPVLLLSCRQEEVSCEEEPSVFEAETEGFPGTRTSLTSNRNVVWSSDDCLMIYEGSLVGNTYKVSEGAEGKSNASFSLIGTREAGDAFDRNLAVYPQSSVRSVQLSEDGFEIAVEIPSAYVYTSGTFASGSFPMTAVTSSLEDKRLKFKNVFGAVMLRLKGEETISSISFRGNSGEILAGEGVISLNDGMPVVVMNQEGQDIVLIDCPEEGVQLNPYHATEFVFSVPPYAFEGGFCFEIILIDGTVHTLETTRANPVVRSSVLKMPACCLDGTVADNEDFIFEISELSPFNVELTADLGGVQYFTGGVRLSQYAYFAGVVEQMNDYISSPDPVADLTENRFPYGFKGNPYTFFYDWSYDFQIGQEYVAYCLPYVEGKEYYTEDDLLVCTFTVPYPSSGGSINAEIEEVLSYPLDVIVRLKDSGQHGSIVRWLTEAEYLEHSSDLAAYMSTFNIDIWQQEFSYSFQAGQDKIYLAALAVGSDGKYGELLCKEFPKPAAGNNPDMYLTAELQSKTYNSLAVSLSAEDAVAIYYSWLPASYASYTDEELQNVMMDCWPQLVQGGQADACYYSAGSGESLILAALAVDENGCFSRLFREVYSMEEYIFNDIIVSAIEPQGDILAASGGSFEITFSSEVSGCCYAVFETAYSDWDDDLAAAEKLLAVNQWYGSPYDFDTPSDTFTLELDYGLTLTIGQEYALIVMAKDASGTYSHASMCRFLPLPSDPDLTGWGITGYFNEWNDDLWMERDGNYLVYKDFTIEADYTEDNTDPIEFKFRKDAGWDWNYGATFKGKHMEGVAYELYQGGQNIVLPDKGTYDIYFSIYMNKYYIMPKGEKPSDYVSYSNE